MELLFVSRSSAVARIVAARQALLKNPDGGNEPRAGDQPSGLEQLDRLLFDVRAGRTQDFVLTAETGKIRMLVTPD